MRSESLWERERLTFERSLELPIESLQAYGPSYHRMELPPLQAAALHILVESAALDQRNALSCSKDGAACGQGWFQIKTPEAVADGIAQPVPYDA